MYNSVAYSKGKTVAYLRLSKEDGDDESVSIANQRRIIEEYAINNHITIDEWFSDDGFSGFTMSRPDFNRLKQELNEDIIDTIIVKDLSRLGRHNAKVQLFLENIHEVGKRVITLSENYDTNNANSHRFVGIQTWINEDFIRETSMKIRGSIQSLMKDGKWLCSIPYGYVKDERDKYAYHIDETIAPYVRLIFDKYIEGMGIKTLARMLTEMNVPTPSMAKKMRAESLGKVYKQRVGTNWDAIALIRMLKNPFYMGTLVLGKSKKRSINGKSISTPEEDWYVFPDAHEPIIDKATFNLVQQIIKDRAEKDYRGKRQSRPNIFAGILYCSDCGKTLTSNSGKAGNTRYICRTYNVHGTSHCTSHAVSEREIKYAILDFLEYCRNNLSEIIADLDNIIQAEIRTKTNSENNIIQLANKIQDTKKSIEILIEQKMRETMKNPSMIDMIDKMYDEMLNDKYKEVQILEKQLNDQNQIALNEAELKNNLNSALSIINEIILSQELTKKQVMLLVDKIVVYEDTAIDICLKGDLHKICHGYFRVSGSKQDKIKKLIYAFIARNPDKFTTDQLTIHVRGNGIPISYKKISKLIKEELLADGLIKVRPMNHGYELVVTKKELRARLMPNIDADIRRWVCNNSEIIEVLIKISEWIQSISTTNKKYLF